MTEQELLEKINKASNVLQEMLDLYNKQQKELEEVRQANKRLFEMGKDKAMTKLTNEIIENEYISKDKIRNKIKEIGNETQYLLNDKGETKQNYAIRKFYELLED